MQPGVASTQSIIRALVEYAWAQPIRLTRDNHVERLEPLRRFGLALQGLVEQTKAGPPERGACFTFTLPSVEDSGGGAVGRFHSISTRREKKEGERLRILTEDDDPRTFATSAIPPSSRACCWT